MHALQPVQIDLSKSTTFRPPAHRPVRAGRRARRIGALIAPGHLEGPADLREPTSTDFTRCGWPRAAPSFSLLHAVMQAWQPLHLLSWSSTNRDAAVAIPGLGKRPLGGRQHDRADRVRRRADAGQGRREAPRPR